MPSPGVLSEELESPVASSATSFQPSAVPASLVDDDCLHDTADGRRILRATAELLPVSHSDGSIQWQNGTEPLELSSTLRLTSAMERNKQEGE